MLQMRPGCERCDRDLVAGLSAGTALNPANVSPFPGWA